MLFTHCYFSFYILEVQSKGGGNCLIGVARSGNGGGFGFYGKFWQKHSSMSWLLLTESLTYITILPFAHTDIGNREGAAGQGRGGGLPFRGVAHGGNEGGGHRGDGHGGAMVFCNREGGCRIGGHGGGVGATHIGCEFQQYSSKPLRACDFMSLITS
jgi:hypothetical protein